MTSKILKIIGNVYSKAIEWIGSYLIVLVGVVMLETAFSRTVFHFPFSALDRINIITMIWACFLVTGLLVEREGHIAVNYFPARFTGLPLYFLKLFIHLALLATFAIVAYYGLVAFRGLYETQAHYPAEIDIPQWLSYIPVFIGMVLGIPFVLHVLIVNIISLYRELKNRTRAAGEKP
jgi:TRAP-type C4-dicarboxylate transport system permease small subunit